MLKETVTKLRENFNARKEELSEARAEVKTLRQQYKALELPCKKPMSPVIRYDYDGGAHCFTTAKRPCFDYEKGKKCTKKTCAACEQNNQKVDLAIKLYAARGDRNRALVKLFFVTRKPAQLLKYMWLKYKAAKLYIPYDESLDKVAGMKTDDSQFDAAVQDKRQKEKAYFLAVADVEAMRDKVFSLTR